MQALYTIIKPVVTEKATALEAKNMYVFWINRKATKIDVKNSIRDIYGVEVADVKMIHVHEKIRSAGRRSITKRAKMKKAIVTLKGRKKLDPGKIGKEPTKAKAPKSSAASKSSTQSAK